MEMGESGEIGPNLGEMGAFPPPWPPALLEPMEYGAFWRVVGSQKAKSREIPPVLSEIRKNQHFQHFYRKMLIFSDFRFLGSRAPLKGSIFHWF